MKGHAARPRETGSTPTEEDLPGRALVHAQGYYGTAAFTVPMSRWAESPFYGREGQDYVPVRLGRRIRPRRRSVRIPAQLKTLNDEFNARVSKRPHLAHHPAHRMTEGAVEDIESAQGKRRGRTAVIVVNPGEAHKFEFDDVRNIADITAVDSWRSQDRNRKFRAESGADRRGYREQERAGDRAYAASRHGRAGTGSDQLARLENPGLPRHLGQCSALLAGESAGSGSPMTRTCPVPRRQPADPR